MYINIGQTWFRRAGLETGRLSVWNPALPVSVVVSLGKTHHPPCLLVLVREPGGASVRLPLFAQVSGCGNNVVYHHQCVWLCAEMGEWLNVVLSALWSSGLEKALYRYIPFTREREIIILTRPFMLWFVDVNELKLLCKKKWAKFI